MRGAIFLLVVACSGPSAPRNTTPPPAPPPRIARCGPEGQFELGGTPFSDDLSGLWLDGPLLWTHTDARTAHATLRAIRFRAPARPTRTLTLSVAAIDPEEIQAAPDGASFFLADTGDNSGEPSCFRYAHRQDDECVLIDRVAGLTEQQCLASRGRVWIRKPPADDRGGPYRILHVRRGWQAPIALLEWSRYPHDAHGRCGGVHCGAISFADERLSESGIGRFDAEAMFVRRERDADGSIGTSLYVVTKAGFPLGALAAMQQRDRCRFDGDAMALVFRIAAVDRMRGRVDVSDRLELVAVLDMNEPDAVAERAALSGRITGANFEGNDLVATTRARTLRWHVPADVVRLDQPFFDAHPPCLAASPPLAVAPKTEAIALEPPRSDGLRGWYVMSEEGDWVFEGTEALAHVAQRWSYEGAVFVRGDVTNDGAVDAADGELLRSIVARRASARCRDAADVNDDGSVDAADVTALAGVEGARCERDATPDELECAAYVGLCAP